MPKYSPYEILDVPIDATLTIIKKQYKRLIREYTPEHHPEQFIKIRTAYEQITQSDFNLIKEFPIYKTPWESMSELKTTVKTSVYKEGLSEIFESPYNTIFELKKLLLPKK